MIPIRITKREMVGSKVYVKSKAIKMVILQGYAVIESYNRSEVVKDDLSGLIITRPQ